MEGGIRRLIGTEDVNPRGRAKFLPKTMASSAEEFIITLGQPTEPSSRIEKTTTTGEI